MNFEDAIAEAVEEGDANATFIECLTLNHSILTDPIRVCMAFESFEVNGIRYEAYPFRLRKPSIEEGSNSVMSIDIDNAGKEIMESIHLASRTREPVTIAYEEFQQIGTTFKLAVQFSVPMDLAEVSRSFDKSEQGITDVLTLKCEHVNLINQTIAHERYLPENFAGLLS